MATAILSLAIIAVCVYILSIVTDEYFVTSLDQIAHKWDLPHNVAGASLMAMGSSAPELAIALLALFKDGGAHSDVGIGTIVGSAVFNILIITGVSAIARPVKVTMKVVTRDLAAYVVSIGLLLVTFRDGTITIFEAVGFLVFYCVYLLVLFKWNQFFPSDDFDMAEVVAEEIHESHKKDTVFQKITDCVSRAIGFFMGDAKTAYIRAFCVSVIFIAVLSWFLVEYAILFAQAVGIPPVIVALTILAGGTSVPDMISSYIVAKQGRGDMAICNAVGSNIFDILIGLGLPWLICIAALGHTVHVGTADLLSSTFVLLGTVFLLFIFLLTGRQVSRKEGVVLVLTYVGYVIWVWLAR